MTKANFLLNIHTNTQHFFVEQAWYGIIGKIAHLLGPLLAPAPMIGSKDERAKRANNIIYSKRHLIDFCLAESSTFISVKKFQLAGEYEYNHVFTCFQWPFVHYIILHYIINIMASNELFILYLNSSGSVTSIKIFS